MRKQQAITSSRFFCTKCGKEGIPIYRKQGKIREAGHLKRLYCIYCKKIVNHAEIREIGGYTVKDFQEEFLAGRFKNGEKKTITQLYQCSNLKCQFNKEGKCWNSNNSAKCKHKPIKEEEK